MGPTWGWQDPGGPHVGGMNFAIWDMPKGLELENVNKEIYVNLISNQSNGSGTLQKLKLDYNNALRTITTPNFKDFAQ